MNSTLPAALFGQLLSLVAHQTGLHFPAERARDFEKGIRAAIREFGFAEFEAGARWLLSAALTAQQWGALASHLTVGETYFLRDPGIFGALETHVLPNLIERRRAERRLRAWSAACCTGEEPYSLAIALRRALPDWANWRVNVRGTDINPRALEKAAQGVYGEWSFRNTPPTFRESYFEKVGPARWRIRADLREVVTFAPLNLAKEANPPPAKGRGAFDLILCCNVLIYFAPDRAAAVLHALAQSLAQGGWLVLGPSEVLHARVPDLTPVNFAGATFFRNDTARSSPAPVASGSAGAVTAGFLPAPALDEPRVTPTPAAEIVSAGDALATCVAPDAPQATLQKARALANGGQLAEALATCECARREEKLNPALHHLQAAILRERGEFSAAQLACQRALYLDQDFLLAHFTLGNIARTQGRRAEAVRHFGTALTLARRLEPTACVPEGEGLTAGNFAELVAALCRDAAPN